MTYLALAFSVFVALMGTLGLAAPDRLLGLVRVVQTPAGLLILVVWRLLARAGVVAGPPARDVATEELARDLSASR